MHERTEKQAKNSPTFSHKTNEIYQEPAYTFILNIWLNIKLNTKKFISEPEAYLKWEIKVQLLS